jgi:hypothetical protein
VAACAVAVICAGAGHAYNRRRSQKLEALLWLVLFTSLAPGIMFSRISVEK